MILLRTSDRLAAAEVERFLRQMTVAPYEVYGVKADRTFFGCFFREWSIEVDRDGGRIIAITRVIDHPGNRAGEPADWPGGLDPHAIYPWWDVAMASADPAWQR